MGGSKCDTAYLLCKVCGKYFSENKGTFFYRKKTDKETISRALKSTVEGSNLAIRQHNHRVERKTQDLQIASLSSCQASLQPKFNTRYNGFLII